MKIPLNIMFYWDCPQCFCRNTVVPRDLPELEEDDELVLMPETVLCSACLGIYEVAYDEDDEI